MKIAYVYADPGPGLFLDGALPIHARACIEALASAGHSLTVFSRQDALTSPPPPGLGRIQWVGVPFPRLAPGLRRLLRDAVAVDQHRPLDRFVFLKTFEEVAFNQPLRRALETSHRERPFDLVLECYSLWHFGAQWAARRCGVPHLLEVHGPVSRETELFYRISWPRLARWLEQRIWLRADRIIAISRRVQELLSQAGISSTRVSVRPPGVRLSDYAHRASGEEVRTRHGLGGSFVLGFVGSFMPWHGLDLLPGLMTALERRGRHWRLLLVGDGPKRKAVLAALEDAGHGGRVTWVGSIPHAQVPAHLAAMDAGLLPSRHEEADHFAPQKLFEYMAAGLPVVASRWGTAENFIEHERTGLLAEPGNADDFAAQLDRLRRDRRFAKALGDASRRKVLKRHTYDGTARLVEEIARQLALDRR